MYYWEALKKKEEVEKQLAEIPKASVHRIDEGVVDNPRGFTRTEKLGENSLK